MNNASLKNFNSIEFKMFIALCSIIKEKGQKELELTFNFIKNLINYKNKNDKQFFNDLTNLNKKLLGCNFHFQDKDEYVQFSLFPTFRTNSKTKILKVDVNKEFSFLLNNLACNFTRFILNEFTNLKSSYSKECYRRLMKYKDTGL